MPPISLTTRSEPHSTIPAHKSVASAVTVAPVAPTWQCQICFDDIELNQENQNHTSAIIGFCGPTCPAVLCRACAAEHVRVSVAAAFPGVLPKVRCPICLTQVNKSKWSHIVLPQVVVKYAEACRTACSFRTPCCENTLYTHLPREVNATDLPRKYVKPAALTLVAELEEQLEQLSTERQRFCDYEILSKDLIIFLEDTFGCHVPIETQHLILEHELPKILDEERRATLLLAYHAKYKVVKTRCCGLSVCFNCKRKMTSHLNGDTTACDTQALDAASVVECRACHVTMVKVEGCSAVRCWCGFTMDWGAEVKLRDRYKKGLIPVDIRDIKLHAIWGKWRATFLGFVTKDLRQKWQAMRFRRIDQQLERTPGLRQTLQKLLQRDYIWRGRFARAVPRMREEMGRVRMRLLAKRLHKRASFMEAVRRAAWRARFARVVPKMRHEMVRVRMLILAKRLKKYAAFPVAVGRAAWRSRFARAFPKMGEEMVKARMLLLAKRLKKCGPFAVAVGRAKWRGHFVDVLPQLKKEVAERRMARCVKMLSTLESFDEALRKAKWRSRWTRVLKSVHAKRFWFNYVREHSEEQRALREREMVMLLPGF